MYQYLYLDVGHRMHDHVCMTSNVVGTGATIAVATFKASVTLRQNRRQTINFSGYLRYICCRGFVV